MMSQVVAWRGCKGILGGCLEGCYGIPGGCLEGLQWHPGLLLKCWEVVPVMY